MAEKNDLIQCGDTDWCDECETADKTITGAKVDVPVHTKNEKGRCDYYRGPNHERHLVAKKGNKAAG